MYPALKCQFNIDDAYCEDLQAELMQGQRLPELWQRYPSHGGNVAYQGCRRRLGDVDRFLYRKASLVAY